MLSANTSIPPSRRRNRRRPRPARRAQYRIREFVGAYAVAVLTNVAWAILAPPVLILSYPISGILLSRYIGQRVSWWKFTASIENVSGVKLHLILSWPVSVPVFVFKVAVVKFL